MSDTMVRNLTLHEAMILALLEHKLMTGAASMTNSELELAVRALDSYRQRDGDHASAEQVFLRARQCREWFELEGDARSSVVTLRPMRQGGA